MKHLPSGKPEVTAEWCHGCRLGAEPQGHPWWGHSRSKQLQCMQGPDQDWHRWKTRLGRGYGLGTWPTHAGVSFLGIPAILGVESQGRWLLARQGGGGWSPPGSAPSKISIATQALAAGPNSYGLLVYTIGILFFPFIFSFLLLLVCDLFPVPLPLLSLTYFYSVSFPPFLVVPL